MRMWRVARMIAVIGPLCWAASVWAGEEAMNQSQPSTTTQGVQAPSSNPVQAPQEPGPAAGPGPTEDLVVYKPISNSMLPVGVTPAGPAATASPVNSARATNLGGAIVMPMGPYTLGRDDVLSIAVRGQPEFTGTYVVGPDGNLQYGYLGDVKAEGLTKEQLQDVLTELLKKYVRVPAVQVMIIGFNSKAIYILGNVAHPGKYAMRGDSIKIRDAVIAAGLVTQHAALHRVHIIKSDPKDPSYKIVNLQDVLYKGKMKQNVDLVAGDIIVVPTTFWGQVTGFIASVTDPASHAGTVASLAAL